MQLLAYRDPTGRVYILNEAQALPLLAEGYEWTMVVQPDIIDASATNSDDVDEPPSRRQSRGFVEDVLVPLLTPREGQSPEERAREVVDALPEEVRAHVGKLMRAFKGANLPPFPGA